MRSNNENLKQEHTNDNSSISFSSRNESFNDALPAIVFNRQGEIVEVSATVCQLIGSSPAELRQMTVADLISQQILREVQLFQQENEGKPVENVTLHHRSDQKGKAFLTSTPILELGLYPHQSHDQFILLLEELETKKSLNPLQQREINTLFQQQRLSEVGLMTSGIAHEINNPITGIINYAQLINQRSSEPVLREFAAEIIKEGERISHLVRNLLNFARNDGNEYQIISAIEIVEDSVNLMRPILRKDDITITIEADADLPDIYCIPQKISQVIVNLISNARQALNNRYPHYHPAKRIIIKNERLSELDGEWLRISITDYGTGISPEVGAKIFEPFFTTHRNNGGTGLGLTLCKMIVAEHQGRLTYSSQINEYTQFCLDLPIKTIA